MALIRRATSADFTAVDEMVREFYALDGHLYDETVVADAFAPLLRDDLLGVVWLFDSGYAVVTWGYSIESGGKHALLDEFYLRTRGQGVGSEVIEEIFTMCSARGINRMLLETERHNERARRFYARHGFVLEDSMWLSRSAGIR